MQLFFCKTKFESYFKHLVFLMIFFHHMIFALNLFNILTAISVTLDLNSFGKEKESPI